MARSIFIFVSITVCALYLWLSLFFWLLNFSLHALHNVFTFRLNFFVTKCDTFATTNWDCDKLNSILKVKNHFCLSCFASLCLSSILSCIGDAFSVFFFLENKKCSRKCPTLSISNEFMFTTFARVCFLYISISQHRTRVLEHFKGVKCQTDAQIQCRPRDEREKEWWRRGKERNWAHLRTKCELVKCIVFPTLSVSSLLYSTWIVSYLLFFYCPTIHANQEDCRQRIELWTDS